MGLRPFGPYSKVERLTEQGAMGVVARGYNAAFDRWELLKFMRPDLANKPEFIRQFFREGRVLAKLSHPNVVQVFAIYTLDGRACLAMEFLEGTSLAGEVAKERLPTSLWHELFLEAARGLAAAHDVGLLHRDLKPENLFVLRPRGGAPKSLKVIDFGLATADRSAPKATKDDPALVAAMSGGTPLYMAPELWRGEEATPRTDVYALGLSFFFALTGRVPFEANTVGQLADAICSSEPFPDVRELRPDLPAPLARVLARAIEKTASARLSSDELVAALVAAASAARARRVPGAGPYRGLVSYSAAERDVFFGRDAEVAEVLEHLRAESGVVLVGPSGSGKSSLARAGVVPAIEEGALGGGVVYGSVLLEPRAHPIHSLAAALARRLGSAEKDVLAFLTATPERLGESLRAALPGEAGVVIVVDQLEELATLSDSAEAHRFAVALGSILTVGAAPVRVVATLRADLMDRLFATPPLRALLTRGFYPVRPMGPDALEQAMVGPAVAAGYRLEDPSIVATVVSDVAKTASGLPLLSFAMAAWWEARDEASRTLPTAAWRALGGLTGALTRHGDQVLGSMNEPSRRLAEQILLRLVSADRTRTRVARASLVDPAAAGAGAAPVLERLLGAKLVHESGGELELAHDALITEWKTLRELLASAGEDRAFRERVAAASREWEAQGRPDGALWTGEQALRLARWFGATNVALGQLELAFALAVRRKETRSRRLARGALLVALVLVLTYGLIAKSNERELRRRLDTADASLKASKAAYVTAETGRLSELAALEVTHDPAVALLHASQSYELAHDPTLDVIAWNARSLGFGVPLVSLGSHPVSLVDVAPRAHWMAAATSTTVFVLATASHEQKELSGWAVGSRPSAIAFSPADQLAIGMADGAIWLASPPKLGVKSVGKCGGVASLSWQDAQSLLALCHDDRTWSTLRIDVASGRSVESPPLAVPEDATAVSLSPNGEAALVGERAGAVDRISVDHPVKGAPLFVREGAPVRVAESTSGARLAIDENRTAALRSPSAPHAFLGEVGSPAFAWIPSRNAVALVGRGEVVIVSLMTMEVMRRLKNPRGEIVSLAADSVGEWLIAGTADGALVGFDLEQGSVALTQGRVGPATPCDLSLDGTAVGCASSGQVRVRVVERSNGAPQPPFVVEGIGSPESLALGPVGHPVLTSAAGVLSRDGQVVALPLRATLVSASDHHVAIAGDSEGHPALLVSTLDLAQPGAPRPLPSPATALAWTVHGTRLLVASATDVHVFDASLLEDTPALVHTTSASPILALAGSDDGAKVVLGNEAGEVLVASRTDAPRRVITLDGPVRCLAFAEAGRAFIASADRGVFVVDTDTGLAFGVATAASPVAQCARGAGEDRFSFVDSDGTAWLKALNLAGVTASYVPEDPKVTPALASWKGLPVGL
jgi:tRNA A-37 threonylcarbamoyl transferase component Bud32